jgi:hypothetical protein
MPVLALIAFAFGPYRDVKIEGWKVRVEASYARDAEWRSVERELSNQLYRIAHVVPDGPLGKLRQVVIWVHRLDPVTQCMAYHPDANWLKEHNMNPAMAHGVEIGSGRNFISWCYEQPWMVLHELAHAYHDQFVPDGFENPDIKNVWKAEMESKRYDQVLHWDGKRVKHYAETNQMEFFAETTEAYFGRNDFYPFVSAELKTYDPGAYKLMLSFWGKPQKRLP